MLINFIPVKTLTHKIRKIRLYLFIYYFCVTGSGRNQICQSRANHQGIKEQAMNVKRIISLGLSLVLFMLVFSNAACKSRKGLCEANGRYQTKKIKKNKSSYGKRYSYKSRPVEKSYVIRNKNK